MNNPLGVCPSKGNPTFSVRPRSSVGRVTVDLIRRSWVRFPPRSKDFFFTSCGSLIPFTRANAQWVIHGLNLALKFTLQSSFSVSPEIYIAYFLVYHSKEVFCLSFFPSSLMLNQNMTLNPSVRTTTDVTSVLITADVTSILASSRNGENCRNSKNRGNS